MVRAKFICTSIDDEGNVHLEADTNSDDSEQWSKYTPNGQIHMLIDNPPALEQFSVGQAYYVDFTPAGQVG